MNKLYFLLLPLIVISCSSQKEVSVEQLVERDGVAYEINSDIPYTGMVIDKNENGLIINRGTYLEGVLHGPYEFFHDNGQLLLKANYVNGVQEGYHESFFYNGGISNKRTYKNGILVGDYLDFYIGGILKEKRVIKEQPENYSLGYTEWGYSYGDYSYEKFDEGGLISERGSYKNGLFDGKKETYTNGILNMEDNWEDGRENGWRIYYDEDGSIYALQCYEDNWPTSNLGGKPCNGIPSPLYK